LSFNPLRSGSAKQVMLCGCAAQGDEMQGRACAHSQSAMGKGDDAADRRLRKQMPALLV